MLPSMPEGPEIRRAADRIERAVGGKVAEEVTFAFPHLQRFEPRLCGRRHDEFPDPQACWEA